MEEWLQTWLQAHIRIFLVNIQGAPFKEESYSPA